MAEFIEREALLKTLKHRVEGLKHHIFDGVNMALSLMEDYVKAIPTADVAEVVRCKGCKHFTAGYCCRDIKGRSQMHYMGENAFCSYGEKMDGKGDKA